MDLRPCSKDAARDGRTVRTRTSLEFGLQARTNHPSTGSKLRCSMTVGQRRGINEIWRSTLSMTSGLISGKRQTATHDVNIFSRVSPAQEPRLVEVPDGICNEVKFPATIHVDQSVTSCRAISTCGRTSAGSRWTTQGRSR